MKFYEYIISIAKDVNIIKILNNSSISDSIHCSYSTFYRDRYDLVALRSDTNILPEEIYKLFSEEEIKPGLMIYRYESDSDAIRMHSRYYLLAGLVIFPVGFNPETDIVNSVLDRINYRVIHNNLIFTKQYKVTPQYNRDPNNVSESVIKKIDHEETIIGLVVLDDETVGFVVAANKKDDGKIGMLFPSQISTKSLQALLDDPDF